MFDINFFKKTIKNWIINNPESDVKELIKFCKTVMPNTCHDKYSWLVDQNVLWFKYLKQQKKLYKDLKFIY